MHQLNKRNINMSELKEDIITSDPYCAAKCSIFLIDCKNKFLIDKKNRFMGRMLY